VGEQSFELIAIGGGFAGLTAAARASELGLSVAVLEAGASDSYPANSRFANGILHLCYQDITQGPETLRSLLTAWTQGEAPRELIDALADTAGRVLEWLKSQAVEIVPAVTNVGNWYLAPPRPLVTHLEWEGWGPDRALRTLKDRILERGGVFLSGHRATRLLVDQGRCAGAICSTAGGDVEVRSQTTVICDGGFSGNTEMFRQYFGRHPDAVLLRGAASARGDGARMAAEAGAALVRLDRFYGHLLCREAMTDGRLWPYPQIDVVACSGVVVGLDGARFLDEGLGGIHAANEIAKLDNPLSTFAVFGEEIWEGPGRTGGLIPPNPVLADFGATVHRANTVGDLARLVGVDVEGLEQTIRAHNRAIESGDAALFPARSKLRVAPRRIDPPFFAIPLCAAITFTMGGIAVDGDARAIGTDGQPICGLYAAGNSIGGLEGGPRADYVGGLVKAFVFGLRAAEHAASSRSSGSAGGSQ